jgi:hypothetical protein
MKKIAIAVLAGLAALATSSHAAEIIKWGDAGGKLDITTNTVLNFSPAGRSSTFSNSTYAITNFAGTASYYPNAEGYSPYFYAAGSSNMYTGQVRSIGMGDRISQYANMGSGLRFKSMVLWDVLSFGTLKSLTMEVNTYTTNCLTDVRLVVEQNNGNYLISELIGSGITNATPSSFANISITDPSTLSWYTFVPFIGGSAYFDSSNALTGVVLNELTGIGYYADTINNNAALKLTGTNVRYFEAEVVPEPATALLLAIGGGLTWLLRLKQWS